jgi:hypothetical protein
MFANNPEIDTRFSDPVGDKNNYFPVQDFPQLLFMRPIETKFKSDGTASEFIEILDLKYGIDELKMDDSNFL